MQFSRWLVRCGLVLIVFVLFKIHTWAADYHVGPGQMLVNITDVPWATLQPGDRVFIHWRATPYQEKWVINRQGTPIARIEIIGVNGPNGQQPIIEGQGASTVMGLNYWNENRGVIKIGGSRHGQHLEQSTRRWRFDFLGGCPLDDVLLHTCCF